MYLHETRVRYLTRRTMRVESIIIRNAEEKENKVTKMVSTHTLCFHE